jgi:hypothetical protein
MYLLNVTPHSEQSYFILKMITPDDVDSTISCAMPEPDGPGGLHENVTKFMLHGPCSERCQDDKKNCRKGYPQNYREETVMDDGRGWIGIRRPRGGPTYLKGSKLYDSRDVVPYNAYLLIKMACHINVLPFRNLKQARYLFKYITKGVDMVCVEKTYQKFGHRIQVTLIAEIIETQTALNNVINPTESQYVVNG